MRSVTLTAHIPGQDAARVYARLSDLASYPDHSESVRSVTVTGVTGDVTLSRWEVAFRNGILRWSQRDVLDPDARTMTFALSEGDAETLEGQWRIEPAEVGCRIHFACDFDLGIPSLADFLDPVAVRLLRETVEAQLTDIFGPDLRVLRAVEPSV